MFTGRQMGLFLLPACCPLRPTVIGASRMPGMPRFASRRPLSLSRPSPHSSPRPPRLPLLRPPARPLRIPVLMMRVVRQKGERVEVRAEASARWGARCEYMQYMRGMRGARRADRPAVRSHGALRPRANQLSGWAEWDQIRLGCRIFPTSHEGWFLLQQRHRILSFPSHQRLRHLGFERVVGGLLLHRRRRDASRARPSLRCRRRQGHLGRCVATSNSNRRRATSCHHRRWICKAKTRLL